MPIVKVKPTSAGRRAVVKVVHPDLHKGAPHAALVEKNLPLPVVTTMATLLPVIWVVVTRSTTV
jgi:hypothetical protein